MTDNVKTQKTVQSSSDETALMIDGLYNYLTRDLQKLKADLLNEMKYSAMQTSALYKSLQSDSVKAVDDQAKSASQVVRELKYGYRQNEAIYAELNRVLSDEVVAKLDTVDGKLALIEEIDKLLASVAEKVDELSAESISDMTATKVLESMPVYDEIDYDKITDAVAEKTEASVAEHSRQVLEAVAAVPVAENVDYTRIVEEVGDRVLEILTETKTEEKPVETAPVEIDYEKIVYGTAEKVVESLPYPEKVDYARVEDAFQKSVESITAKMDADATADLVLFSEEVRKAIAEIDYDAIAAKVAEKIVVPEQPAFDYDLLAVAIAARSAQPEPIDYDKLADAVLAKLPAPEPIDYEKLADMVAAKLQVEKTDDEYEVVIDSDGLKEVADGVAKELDLDAIAAKVAEKLIPEETDDEVTYEMLLDEEGVQAIADAVAKELCGKCAPCEETVEEPAVVEEQPEEELAIADATEETVEEEPQPEFVDADAGLVVRMKRSFTAKMKQSDDSIKGYYSAIKNAFGSYKKLNSTVSWHGDRFNYGRETVAKMNIVGKTLNLYLALDPNDPEFKTTVYHQKDASGQKAYESTPFLVKIRSEMALKKALRLVDAVAAKVGALKKANFEPTDYKDVFAYETDEELLEKGLVKSTKEKKVVWNF